MAKEVKYIVLQLNNNEGLKSFIDEYLNIIGEEKGKYTVYQLDGANAYKNYRLFDLVDAIKLDFDENIKVFETCVLDKECYNDLEKLISIYEKFENKSYMNIISLYKISKEKYLKDIIISSFKDESLLSIAKAMFKNNLNVSKTSVDVYMHRNTVINKLSLIEAKTGLDIQSFNDAVLLYNIINGIY